MFSNLLFLQYCVCVAFFELLIFAVFCFYLPKCCVFSQGKGLCFNFNVEEGGGGRGGTFRSECGIPCVVCGVWCVAGRDEIKLVVCACVAACWLVPSKAEELLASDNSTKPVLTPTKNLVKGQSYAQLPALPRPRRPS